MTSLFANFFPPEVVTFVSDRRVDYAREGNQGKLSHPQNFFLAEQLNLRLPEVVTSCQVHSEQILFVTQQILKDSVFQEEADGLLTSDTDLPLGIRTADCLPIFFYDIKKKGVGLAHAGWKGSVKRIAVGMISLMQSRLDSKPQDIQIAFGPCIRPCCYEVTQEFSAYFPEGVTQRNGSYYLDLAKVNKLELLRLGIQEKNIFDCLACTCCDKKYFSYRRDGIHTGRMLSLIMLRGEKNKDNSYAYRDFCHR